MGLAVVDVIFNGGCRVGAIVNVKGGVPFLGWTSISVHCGIQPYWEKAPLTTAALTFIAEVGYVTFWQDMGEVALALELGMTVYSP
jgi:acyl-CoA hydrolase